jgi:hypothetical protein
VEGTLVHNARLLLNVLWERFVAGQLVYYSVIIGEAIVTNRMSSGRQIVNMLFLLMDVVLFVLGVGGATGLLRDALTRRIVATGESASEAPAARLVRRVRVGFLMLSVIALVVLGLEADNITPTRATYVVWAAVCASAIVEFYWLRRLDQG